MKVFINITNSLISLKAVNPFFLYVVNMTINEITIKLHSNCRSASQVSYVAVGQWLEILINGFFLKNLGKY